MEAEQLAAVQQGLHLAAFNASSDSGQGSAARLAASLPRAVRAAGKRAELAYVARYCATCGAAHVSLMHHKRAQPRTSAARSLRDVDLLMAF